MNRCPICGNLRRAAACTRCTGVIARPQLLLPRRGGAVGELVAGTRIAARSIYLTLTRPSLFVLAALPLALSAAAFVVMAWLVWTHRDSFRPDFASEWHWSVDWLRAAIAFVAEFAFVLVAIVVSLLATLVIQTVLNAPFNEWLSEAAESLVLGEKDKTPLSLHKIWHVWLVPLAQAVVLAAIQAALAVLLLVASFTGVLAPFVFIASVWLTAVTLVDVAIARKRFPVGERFAIVRADFAMWFGLAWPFALFPFLLPLGVVGGTFAEMRQRLPAVNTRADR